MNLEKRTVCLHQVTILKEYPKFLVTDNQGDCSDCVYDPVNNPKCVGYVPVTLNYFEVKYD